MLDSIHLAVSLDYSGDETTMKLTQRERESKKECGSGCRVMFELLICNSHTKEEEKLVKVGFAGCRIWSGEGGRREEVNRNDENYTKLRSLPSFLPPAKSISLFSQLK